MNYLAEDETYHFQCGSEVLMFSPHIDARGGRGDEGTWFAAPIEVGNALLRAIAHAANPTTSPAAATIASILAPFAATPLYLDHLVWLFAFRFNVIPTHNNCSRCNPSAVEFGRFATWLLRHPPVEQRRNLLARAVEHATAHLPAQQAATIVAKFKGGAAPPP